MRYRCVYAKIGGIVGKFRKPTYNKHRGAMSELAASAWLMEQGFEVFRNVSHFGKYDLIIRDLETEEFTPIDVTTGSIFIKKDGSESINWSRKEQEVLTLVVMADGRFLWAKGSNLI